MTFDLNHTSLRRASSVPVNLTASSMSTSRPARAQQAAISRAILQQIRKIDANHKALQQGIHACRAMVEEEAGKCIEKIEEGAQKVRKELREGASKLRRENEEKFRQIERGTKETVRNLCRSAGRMGSMAMVHSFYKGYKASLEAEGKVFTNADAERIHATLRNDYPEVYAAAFPQADDEALVPQPLIVLDDHVSDTRGPHPSHASHIRLFLGAIILGGCIGLSFLLGSFLLYVGLSLNLIILGVVGLVICKIFSNII